MYYLSAVIGQANAINEIETMLLFSQKHVNLMDDILMIPLTNELYSFIISKYEQKFNVVWFDYLNLSLYDIIKESSKLGKICYVEAEYFGGKGSHSSIAFKDNCEVFREIEIVGSIDKALKHIGVLTINDKDEFDSIGLGKYRDTESWIEHR